MAISVVQAAKLKTTKHVNRSSILKKKKKSKYIQVHVINLTRLSKSSETKFDIFETFQIVSNEKKKYIKIYAIATKLFDGCVYILSHS